MLERLLILTVLCLPLSCGFQLRGSIDLPEQIAPLYIERFGTDNDLRRELRALLSQSAAANLADSRESATAELKILSAKNKRRVIAVDDRGRARHYELSYKVVYRISGEKLPADRSSYKRQLKLKRELLFDPDSVLAISHEQEMLYEDMRKDAARMILQQLKATGTPAETNQ